MKYQAIVEHRGAAPTRWLCSALEVSARGFYDWRRRPESHRTRRDRQLLVAIRASYERSRRVYGSPRVRLDLQDSGEACSRKRIARIMQGNGLVAVQRRRFKATTMSGHDFPVTANLLERNFTAAAPNQVWLGDITYIATEEGWLYLAALLDLYSRKIVGWSTAERIDRMLTLTTLETALRVRQPSPGLIHHTDRGSQYAAYEYQKRLEQAQARSSMSRRGDCYDNAPMESFFSTLKRERVHRRRYWTRDEATDDLGDYIDGFYNLTRRHSELGGVSPIQYETMAKLT
jgi:transposase InsO family protein